MSKRSKCKIVGHDGEPCPRCGKPTEIREHVAITEEHLRKPYYFERWFCCHNSECKTTTIMPERFRVFRDEATRRHWEEGRYNATAKTGDVVWGESWDAVEKQTSDRPPWE